MGPNATNSPIPPASRTGSAIARPRLRAMLAGAGISLLAALAVPAPSSEAQGIDELNSRIAGAREQADGLAAEIDATSTALASAQSKAIAAAAREAELSETLARGQARERELEGQVRLAESELAATREQLGRARAALAGRLVEIYKSGDTDAIAVLLDADGFDDLATRAEYLKRIESADRALVARVQALRDEVELRLAAVERSEAQVAAFNAQVAGARSQIAAVRAEAEAHAGALAAARSEHRAALAGLEQQVGEWTARVERLERVPAPAAEQEVADWLGDWAIPEAIVMCESGGNWNAVNPSSGAGGAYQILPSTWELYGGRGAPEDASPAQQSEIASQIWSDSGAGAWVCAG